jgi:hypothetical protein
MAQRAHLRVQRVEALVDPSACSNTAKSARCKKQPAATCIIIYCVVLAETVNRACLIAQFFCLIAILCDQAASSDSGRRRGRWDEASVLDAKAKIIYARCYFAFCRAY